MTRRHLPTLDDFIRSAEWPFSSYVTHPGFENLYVRRFVREGLATLDIGSITARSPGKGQFTLLRSWLTANHPELNVYVECVHNTRFQAYLERAGFVRVTNDPSYLLRRKP